MSTEHQRFLVLHHQYSKCSAMALTHNQCIGRLYGQKCEWWYLPRPLSNELQWSINDSWPCILDNVRAMEWWWPTINILVASTGKNGSGDLAIALYHWAPTELQQHLWGLSNLHSNELQCIVPKFSVTRSVLSICPCIQRHKFACNVSQIPLFLLVALESILNNPYCNLL